MLLSLLLIPLRGISYISILLSSQLGLVKPLKTVQHHSDILQTFLNRSYNSLEWCLNSSPKPHAFVSLPVQSKIGFKFTNLKEKFTLRNILITFVSLVFAYGLKLFLIYLLALDVGTCEHFLLLGFIASIVRPLFMDLFEIIFPTLYCMDKDIEESIAAKSESVGNSGASANQASESASVNQASKSASVNQASESASVNQASESASVNQASESASVNQASESASANQASESASASASASASTSASTSDSTTAESTRPRTARISRPKEGKLLTEWWQLYKDVEFAKQTLATMQSDDSKLNDAQKQLKHDLEKVVREDGALFREKNAELLRQAEWRTVELPRR